MLSLAIDRPITDLTAVNGTDHGNLIDADVASPPSLVRSPQSSTDLMNGFEIGDMVWGKVKSHPWWPGHIFNESFASYEVRRHRRDAFVLVAFFGDSSYGWFDPTELIPFEPSFPEKSTQTNTKQFLKSVAEAVDEFARRAALGLTCRCRNANNFRDTEVSGYFSVDVPGFEQEGIYSLKQIESSRNRFVPEELLGFVRDLAVAPKRRVTEDCEWISSFAIAMAYRRAVFEEFDETYAQAFGQTPERPKRSPASASRAKPLSGQQKIPEALGDKHRFSSSSASSSKKPSASASRLVQQKVKKKNDYLLKRRENYNNDNHSTSGTANTKPLLPDLHLLPNAFDSQQQNNFFSTQTTTAAGATSSSSLQQQETMYMGSNFDEYVLQRRNATAGYEGSGPSEYTYIVPERDNPDSPSTPPYAPVDVTAWKMMIEQSMHDAEVSNAAATATSTLKYEQPSSSLAEFMPSAFEIKHPKVKKEKIKKRKLDDQLQQVDDGTGTAPMMKKKKKKKGLGSLEDCESPQVPKVIKKKSAMKQEQNMITVGEELQTRKPPPCPAAFLPVVDLSSLGLELPELVGDLLALALDPFYCVERNAPSIISQVFLKFRSLVYQKSLVLPPASEPESSEPKIRKLASIMSKQNDSSPRGKMLKRPLKTDDPTISGRKRVPSERQEENSAKKMKKVEKLKTLAAERKSAGVVFKTPDQGNQKDASTGVAGKISKAEPSTSKNEPVKKPVPPPPKVLSPTYVIMKFPPRTTLPSVATLKARFARFGPLDLSGTRVYWKSYTCKVLFKYKVDAASAMDHANSNDLFGQIKVSYSIREVEQETSETSKLQADLYPNDSSIQFRPGSQIMPFRQSTVPVKSILKKPNEAGVNASAGVVKGVKFMLGDERKEAPSVVVSEGDGNGNGSSSLSTSPLLSTSSLPAMIPSSSKDARIVTMSAVPRAQMPPPPPLNPSALVGTSRFPPPKFPFTPNSSNQQNPMQQAGLGQSQPWQSAPFSGSQPQVRHPDQALQDQGQPSNSLTLSRHDRREVGEDVTGPLLDLMLKTYKIINNAASRTGYSPYDPIWRNLPL